MIPSSLVVIAATASLTLLAALVLIWAWRQGYFDNLDAQSKVIFDERDWRTERQWETPLQQLERETRFGPLVKPLPGEWGGAQ